MGIFKNLFKNDEDTLSIIKADRITDEINTKAIELANKLKSMLVAMGYTQSKIKIDGITFTIHNFYNSVNGDYFHLGIQSKDNEQEVFLDIDEPFTFYDVPSEKNKTICPATFEIKRYFLEHANEIFNKVKPMFEKHEKDCLNILEQVKDL
jgi:hypothetical protein